MFGTNGTASPSEVISLGYNRAWINSQMIALGNATTTVAGMPFDSSFISTDQYPISSQRFWILYSDVEDITAANQFGLFSSSNTTALDGDGVSKFIWTVPVGYEGEEPINLTTNDINQAGYGTYNGTGLTGTVRTAAAPTALYWDADHPGTGGTGTWNSTSTVWSTDSGGVANNGQYAWGTTSGTDYYAGAGLTANFGGTAGTVTVSGSVDALSGLTFETTGYTLTSGTINLAGATAADNTISVSTGTTTINSILAGSTGLTKAGSGTAALSAANTFTGTTTVNSGTLEANAAGALGSSTVINVNGGSFLVGASDSVNDSAAINLNGGTLALGSSVGEVVGALTLSANSTLDMNTAGDAWISFASLTSVLTNTTRLEVWNYTPGSDHIYFLDSTNLASSLDYISFYSGAGTGTFYNALNTSSFSAPEVYATIVPEPGVYLTAAILLIGMGIFMLRRQISLPDTSPANQQNPSPDTIRTPMVNK
jgi:autotransporter-associated beta strand protein